MTNAPHRQQVKGSPPNGGFPRQTGWRNRLCRTPASADNPSPTPWNLLHAPVTVWRQMRRGRVAIER